MHLHPDSDHLIAKFERSEFRYFLNLAPINFNQVVGLYIATLLIVWQVISFVAFRSVPNLPILCGGALVTVGGLIISFWKPV